MLYAKKKLDSSFKCWWRWRIRLLGVNKNWELRINEAYTPSFPSTLLFTRETVSTTLFSFSSPLRDWRCAIGDEKRHAIVHPSVRLQFPIWFSFWLCWRCHQQEDDAVHQVILVIDCYPLPFRFFIFLFNCRPTVKCQWRINKNVIFIFYLQRPPSSSLSYSGPGNDDTRSPGSVGGTPGPLSAAPPLSQQSVDNVSEAGKKLQQQEAQLLHLLSIAAYIIGITSVVLPFAHHHQLQDQIIGIEWLKWLNYSQIED